MTTRVLLVYAASSVLAALLIVWALHGADFARFVNFVAPAIFLAPGE
jgi:hypothetical protein